MAQTSQHYYIEGLKGALNWNLIMPRNASLSRDSRSKVFFYFKINIYFYLNWKKKLLLELNIGTHNTYEYAHSFPGEGFSIRYAIQVYYFL